MDGLTLRAVVAELNALRGKRLEGVTAPEAHEIHLVLDGSSIVLSAHPAHNTLYVSGSPPAAPGETGLSVRLARGLERCRFEGATQLGLDRVVILAFRRRDRLGDAETRSVVVELIGKGANLLLVEGDAGEGGGRILDQMRSGRQGNGEPYRPPASAKADLTRDGSDVLVERLKTVLAEGKPGPGAVLSAWAGLGPQSAEEVWTRAGEDADPETLARTWIAMAKERAPGAKTADHNTASAKAQAEAEAYRARTATRSGTPRRKAVRQAIKRVEHALEQMREEDKESAEAPRLRQTGNLLLSFAHAIPRGQTEVDLTDPETGEIRRIKLNPKLGPPKNAELYFKRARKAERRGMMAEKRRKELENRLSDLKDLARRLPESETEPEGDWFREARRLGVKLPQTDVAKDPRATAEDLLPSAIRPRRYTLGNGWELLVGKSNRGNEVLTHEIARPGDVWMHADQAAGSHAVLRHHEKGKEPPRSVILAAAAVAAFYSKARNASKVPVLITQKRHVRRARKAPVGTVMVGQHETVMVRPADLDQEKDKE